MLETTSEEREREHEEALKVLAIDLGHFPPEVRDRQKVHADFLVRLCHDVGVLREENERLTDALDSAEREFSAWFVQPSVERAGNLFEPGAEPDNAAGRGLRILRARQT